MKLFPVVALMTSVMAPALVHAEGDVAAGEEQFNRQCISCHVIRNDDGEILAGRSAKAGPNLFGVAGNVLGTVEGFR